MSESSSILCVIGRDLITATKSSSEVEEYDNFDREWLFHVLIVPVFQAWWKMINFWWIAIDLWTSVETVELDGTRPKNYPILIRVWSNSVGFLVFSWTHCTGGRKTGLTLEIEFSTHRKVMDKPSWGLTKLITKFKFSFKKWPFVTTSGGFYVNLAKNRNFEDLDKVLMNILVLMCSNGPGW